MAGGRFVRRDRHVRQPLSRARGRAEACTGRCWPGPRNTGAARHPPCPAACSTRPQASSSASVSARCTSRSRRSGNWAWPSASSTSRRARISSSRRRRAVARNPPRRRSSASAMSAVRACSDLPRRLDRSEGLHDHRHRRPGSPTREQGPRKSGPTSVRGHSATQYVACHVASTRSRPHSAATPMGHGHGPVPFPDGAGTGRAGAESRDAARARQRRMGRGRRRRRSTRPPTDGAGPPPRAAAPRTRPRPPRPPPSRLVRRARRGW